MDKQTTFRLPQELSRTLTRVARERGVPKSQLVREALERYLYPQTLSGVMTVRERGAPYVGTLRLDPAAVASDPVSALIRERNWRE